MKPTHSLHISQAALSVQDGLSKRLLFHIDSMDIPAGSCTGIFGISGSGKSSFLNMLCGLTKPDSVSDTGKKNPDAHIFWGDVDIVSLSEQERDLWRGSHVGLVFQDFRLFPGLNALENILLPQSFRHFSISEETKSRALALLHELNIHKPFSPVLHFSRGEMQRVAIARALLGNPSIILADEPSASLDPQNAEQVNSLLPQLARKHGASLIIISHDLTVKKQLDFSLSLTEGHFILSSCRHIPF